MKNKQLVLRSAATVVATGLTLLASNNSQAGRGFSGKMAGGGRGSMTNGAMHQSIGNHGMTGSKSVIGQNRSEHRMTTQVNRRDDHGGRGGHREPGDDRGGRGERERRHGNDDGRRHDLRDDKGGHGERERRHGRDDGIRHDLRDDRGGRGERERRHGNDDGKRHELRDDKGGHGERERRHSRDDGKRHDLNDDKGGRGEREHRHGERERGDDHGRR